MTEKTKTKLLKKTALAEALGALMAEYSVFAPAKEAERQAFTRISAENMDSVNLAGAPVLPTKGLLLPRSETLFEIGLGTGDASVPEYAGDTLLFGARPCDARSIVNLDCVFLDERYKDGPYAARRECLTVVANACAEIPGDTCFCDSMGGSPAGREGADVLLRETRTGNAWIADFITDKGRRVEALWQAAGLLSAPGRASAKEPPACKLRPGKPECLPEKLVAAFENPAWARFSEACIGCGVCSYICPTCYCFDIGTETRGDKAEEFRCWDCCMFSDYSRMAGGHDPRPTKKERFRNRCLHKLAYFDERYGRTLCVGCGRCILKCPAGIDIAAVIEWGATL